jgi:ATP-dependent Clp protease ATP-binding subunit ClpC
MEAISEPSRDAVDPQRHFSDQAKEILQRAAERAVQAGKREVDTEHLLYELPQSDVVQAILKRFKISVDDLRAEIEADFPSRAEDRAEPSGQIGISPRVKSALDRAFIASRELGHSYVGPEHILIGLAEVRESFAGDLLAKYGISPSALRQQSVKVVGKGAEEGEVTAPSNTPQLDKYSRDLSKMAREGKLDPVIGRAKEIETTIEVLARRRRIIRSSSANPVSARPRSSRASRNGSSTAKSPKSCATSASSSLTSIACRRRQISRRVRGARQAGDGRDRREQGELLLFIDEVHTIVGAGRGGEGGRHCQQFQAGDGAWRNEPHRSHDAQGISEIYREGRGARTALPARLRG